MLAIKRKILFMVINTLLSLVFSCIATAEIYMCKNDDGRVTYHADNSNGQECKKLDTETDEEKVERQRELDDFPKIGMKIYDKQYLCINYGKVLRGEKEPYFISAKDDLQLLRKELKRRKLKVDDQLIKKQEIKLRNSVCSLYASHGKPYRESKSVGTWGVHIQHIYYGDSYIYSENGKITSWQQ